MLEYRKHEGLRSDSVETLTSEKGSSETQKNGTKKEDVRLWAPLSFLYFIRRTTVCNTQLFLFDAESRARTVQESRAQKTEGQFEVVSAEGQRAATHLSNTTTIALYLLCRPSSTIASFCVV